MFLGEEQNPVYIGSSRWRVRCCEPGTWRGAYGGILFLEASRTYLRTGTERWRNKLPSSVVMIRRVTRTVSVVIHSLHILISSIPQPRSRKRTSFSKLTSCRRYGVVAIRKRRREGLNVSLNWSFLVGDNALQLCPEDV